MPDQELAYVTYPGVLHVEACSYTLSHGISPGVAALDIVPQVERISEQGDLVFIQGTTRIVLRDCKVNTSNIRGGDGGFVVSLSLYDRRWKWGSAGGYISGHYNLLDNLGNLITDTEKSPQDLAKMLLEAMGEAGFDVSQLPNDVRPTVEWEAAVPAVELEGLASQLGCRVVLGLDNRVRLCRTGFGAALPKTDTEDQGNDGFDPPELPDKLLCIGGKRRCQADLRLEAVGYETDGTLKPINDLSYMPSGGWEAANFPNVTNPMPSEDERALAKRYVFRLYRYTLALWDGTGSNEDPALYIPGAEEVAIIDDRKLLELEDVQVETFTDAVTGEQRYKPAEIRGEYWLGGASNSNQTFPTNYRFPFSIVDKKQGLVEFPQYVYKNDSSNRWTAPDLILRCAVSVRDPETRAWLRHTKEKVPPGPKFGTKERVLLHEEIVENVYPEYGADTYPTGAIVTNKETIEKEMDYYLDAAVRDYQAVETSERQYPGFLAISPDGAIQQVSWELGEGSSTKASRNSEHSNVVPPYAQRRLMMRLSSQKIGIAIAQAVAQRAKK